MIIIIYIHRLDILVVIIFITNNNKKIVSVHHKIDNDSLAIIRKVYVD